MSTLSSKHGEPWWNTYPAVCWQDDCFKLLSLWRTFGLHWNKDHHSICNSVCDLMKCLCFYSITIFQNWCYFKKIFFWPKTEFYDKKKVKLSADTCDIFCYFHASSWKIRWLHRTIYWIIEDPVIASAWREHLEKSECSPTGELDMLLGLVGAAHLNITCNCKTKVFHHNAQL